jgi:transposase
MNTNANDLILAIDLGKYKSVVCTYRTPEDHQFTKISTSGDKLTKLVRRVQPAVVLVEACLLSGWVHDLCGVLGVKCLVANTSSEAWKFKHSKRKTDEDDAQRLAELYRLGQLPTVTVPSPETGQQPRHEEAQARRPAQPLAAVG